MELFTATLFNKTGNIVERLAFDIRHLGLFFGIAHHHNHRRSLIGWATQEGAQKSYRARRVGECGQADMIESRQQDAGGDADAFRHIVILSTLARRIDIITALKDDDQIGRDLEIRLFGVGAKRLQGFQPGFGCAAAVKLTLCFFRFQANAAFDLWRSDNNKMPGLKISAAGRCAGAHDAFLDDATRNRAIRKHTHREAPGDGAIKISGAARHGGAVAHHIAAQRYGAVFRYMFILCLALVSSQSNRARARHC